jgi:hypothetical protein
VFYFQFKLFIKKNSSVFFLLEENIRDNFEKNGAIACGRLAQQEMNRGKLIT